MTSIISYIVTFMKGVGSIIDIRLSFFFV
jgi:hypothetical protein